MDGDRKAAVIVLSAFSTTEMSWKALIFLDSVNNATQGKETTPFVGFIQWNLVVMCFVLDSILLHRNWAINRQLLIPHLCP